MVLIIQSHPAHSHYPHWLSLQCSERYLFGKFTGLQTEAGKILQFFTTAPRGYIVPVMIISFGPTVLRNSSKEMYSMYVLTAGHPQCRKQNSISTLTLIHRKELEVYQTEYRGLCG